MRPLLQQERLRPLLWVRCVRAHTLQQSLYELLGLGLQWQHGLCEQPVP